MATATKNRTFPTSVSLSEEVRSQVIDILNARLADTIDLRTQTKQAHWNLKGRQFLQLHELFDTVAEHLDDHGDTIAERVTALGGVANGTARQVASASAIPEYDLDAVSGEEHLCTGSSLCEIDQRRARGYQPHRRAGRRRNGRPFHRNRS